MDYTVIGLMSGTSLDGVDAALIKTDGEESFSALDFMHLPYPEDFRENLYSVLGCPDAPHVKTVEEELTRYHIKSVQELLNKTGAKVDLIGFHGQTIAHDPAQKMTRQIGGAELLFQETKIPVVYDFRTADVKAGGQGAPLVPVFHQALAKALNLPLPCAFLNLGGVGNVTYIDHDNLLAFDTGPGNALIDDWVHEKAGLSYDKNGALAAAGELQEKYLEPFRSHPFLKKTPPKSLDRQDFQIKLDRSISIEDGARTLTELTAHSVACAFKHLPSVPKVLYVCGGGRLNRFLLKRIQDQSPCPVKLVEEIGLNGDALEAQAFGYLAVRSLKKLPLTFPKTTGVLEPLTGGRLVPTHPAGFL